MSDSLVFDAELEGLLREIAADPGSRLLRLPRPARPRDLLAMPEPAGRARAGLSTAERQLLEVHRDELAHLLRRACLMRFFSDPVRSIYVNRSKTANESIQVDTPEEWQARAHQALDDARSSPSPLSGIELVEACLRSDRGASISITELARASQVLQATDVAEDYVGLDQVLCGDRVLGEQVLWQLISKGPSPYLLSCALETIGLSAGLHVDERVAMEHYRSAVRVFPAKLNSIMSWLFFATRLEDKPEALRASDHLEAVHIETELVESFVTAHRTQDERGAMRATSRAQQLAAELKESVGETTRRVLDAL